MAGLGQEVFIPNMSFTSGNQSPLIPEKTSTALKGSPNQLNVCYTALGLFGTQERSQNQDLDI
jgi:hypothetical protein